MTEEDINKAIARVILSTKRRIRQYSLFDIANDLQALKAAKGGIKEVADLIGISAGMLNQFLSVFKLPKEALELVKDRKIDSVAMVHYLSKFNSNDISKLAQLLASNELTSQELRILLPYRKHHTNDSILDLVERIRSSKNIKVSIIRISSEDTSKTLDELKNIFSKHVGMENYYSIVSMGKHIDIKFSKEGEKRLRKSAKDKNMSLQEFITSLII